MLLTAAFGLAGCHPPQPSITRELLVGSYGFICQDPESRMTDHNLNHLVLKPDGTYDVVEGGTTKPIAEKKGVWRVGPGTPRDGPLNVFLDNAGYPIEIKRGEIRLLVDLDVGVWWVKTIDENRQKNQIQRSP